MPTIRQQDVGPATNIPWASAVTVRLESGAVSQYDLVQITGEDSGVFDVTQADASALNTAKGRLLIMLDAVSAGDTATYLAVPWILYDTNLSGVSTVDTSGAAAGDPMYLSDTAGGAGLPRGTVARVVGQVQTVAASAGAYILDPNGSLALLGGYGVKWSAATIADSANVGGTAAPVAFDQTLTVPANLLTTGTTLKIRAVVRFPTTVGTDTALLVLQVGGDALVTSSVVDVANDDTAIITAYITTRAAPGASIDYEGGGACTFSTGAAGTLSTASTLADAQTLATNADITIDVTCDWSTTNANVARLVHLSAEAV